MSDKWRTTVSIDSHVAEDIQDDDAPFSPLVNKWAEDYYLEGKRPLMQEHQVEEMLEEIEAHEDELDQMYKSMKQMLSRHKTTLRSALGEEADEGELDHFYEEMTDWQESPLKSVDEYVNNGVPRDPNNPAVHQAAQQLGMGPEKLVSELKKRDARDGYIQLEEDEQ